MKHILNRAQTPPHKKGTCDKKDKPLFCIDSLRFRYTHNYQIAISSVITLAFTISYSFTPGKNYRTSFANVSLYIDC